MLYFVIGEKNDIFKYRFAKCKVIPKHGIVSGKVDNDTKPELLYRNRCSDGEDIWHVLHKK